MNVVKRGIKILIDSAYIFVLVCALAYLFSSYKVYKGKEIVPNILGYYGFTINTGSMEPAINVGDYLISKKVKINDIDVGNIITFIEEDLIITHRVVDIISNDVENTILITKGDANNIEDDTKVSIENVIGKYVLAVPRIGYILDYFKYINPLYKIAILSLLYFIYLCVNRPINIKIKEDVSNEQIKQKN